MTQVKTRKTIFLSPNIEVALADYAHKHRARFETDSQAADHLLGRALTADLGEGAEAQLLPAVQRTVQAALRQELPREREELLRGIRETARRETEDIIAKHTRSLGNRVAAMLVNAGKDAHTAALLCKLLLEYDLEDEGRVEAYWQEAQLAAGKRYSPAKIAAERPDGGAGRAPDADGRGRE